MKCTYIQHSTCLASTIVQKNFFEFHFGCFIFYFFNDVKIIAMVYFVYDFTKFLLQLEVIRKMAEIVGFNLDTVEGFYCLNFPLCFIYIIYSVFFLFLTFMHFILVLLLHPFSFSFFLTFSFVLVIVSSSLELFIFCLFLCQKNFQIVPGMLVPGGSFANMVGMIAARHNHFPHVRMEGWKSVQIQTCFIFILRR